MNKSGLNIVISTVLLITISLTLAVIIFTWAKGSVSTLSPPQEKLCEKVEFKSEIYKDTTFFYLAAVNKGPIEISKLLIKSVKSGNIKTEEELDLRLSPGASNTTQIISITQQNNEEFLIVPEIIERTDKEIIIVKCPNKYGEKIVF